MILLGRLETGQHFATYFNWNTGNSKLSKGIPYEPQRHINQKPLAAQRQSRFRTCRPRHRRVHGGGYPQLC